MVISIYDIFIRKYSLITSNEAKAFGAYCSNFYSISRLSRIPFHEPRFIHIAVLFEFFFMGLAILVSKGFTRPLYICIILASLIIIGNSITTAHIHRMMTFVKPLNTIVLIISEYILQGLLIYASAVAIMDKRRTMTASHY
jgi:hypothetical protein